MPTLGGASFAIDALHFVQHIPQRFGRSIARGRIDDAGYLFNTIGRKAALLGMFANRLLVVGNVNAIHLVAGDIALQPLNLRAHLIQDAAGFLGNALQVRRAQRAGIRNVAFDNVFWHGLSPRNKLK